MSTIIDIFSHNVPKHNVPNIYQFFLNNIFPIISIFFFNFFYFFFPPKFPHRPSDVPLTDVDSDAVFKSIRDSKNSTDGMKNLAYKPLPDIKALRDDFEKTFK
jgi:hypothetical protein